MKHIKSDVMVTIEVVPQSAMPVDYTGSFQDIRGQKGIKLRSHGCSMPLDSTKRKPDEWLALPKYVGLKVLDPDGWDRKNYEQSWAEPITEGEFNRRICESTCVWPNHLSRPPKFPAPSKEPMVTGPQLRYLRDCFKKLGYRLDAVVSPTDAVKYKLPRGCSFDDALMSLTRHKASKLLDSLVGDKE